jgi:hypothetical protein
METSSRILLACGALFWAVAGGWAAPGNASDENACKSLAQADFSGVTDAPTQIVSAELVQASKNVPAYCEVKGYVEPAVGFLLGLPLHDWNGKFLEHGCSGFCGGDLADVARRYPGYYMLGSLRRGYAALMFDGGHVAGGVSPLWAYNNLQAQFDFGIRGAHVAALAGKAITEHYYKAVPSKSYFTGCGGGVGQQALSEAQRYPWDFDGIISGTPSPTFSGPAMTRLWTERALAGTLNEADLKFVYEKAVAKCDMDDGVKDGVIGDPLHCKFDPAELLCSPTQKTGCLTASQVEAVKKVYSGPTTSRGEKINNGGPLPGSEIYWIEGDFNSPTWYGEYFRYMGFIPPPGPAWKPADFDFNRDYKRLRMAESVVGAADNPDLREFKAAGGKLLLYRGAQDESAVTVDAIDYYETVEKTMGGRDVTQNFLRFFLVPGMIHCSNGPGPFAVDYLTYLERWVEKGQAPDQLIGAHMDTTDTTESFRVMFPLDSGIPVSFTRPIYPYPFFAKYKGTGNPNDAANFEPIDSGSRGGRKP